MRIYCPLCKTENREERTVCIKCGADLLSADTLLFSNEPVPQQTPATEIKTNLEFMHGQDFGIRYRIIEEIGRGGMGKVYKAYDKELNKVVALKMIRPEHFANPEAMKLFKNELLLAQEVTNKNVIRIHDIGEANGIKYISMPFIEGLTLKDYIRTSRKVSIDAAIHIIQQICNGLNAAHENGILHRDLKTRNIMVDHEGQVYILDFGIAKSLLAEESSSLDGKIVGTPEYISPEQAQAKPSDQRSDIYSLGIVMYELLTGKIPFSGDTTSDILVQQITTAPRNPSEFNPDIPQFMEKIILKCLEKDPANRYQSIQEVIDALSKVTVPWEEKKLKNRWQAGVSAAAIAAICIALYFIYFRQASRPSAPVVPSSQTQKVVLPKESSPAPLSTQWKNSIAVLPFKNISSEPNQDYFCDGMTEQLISNLARLKGLKVIARTSIMAYKNTTKDIRQIAKELNVTNILEGSVRKSGSQVRITAQLINASDGSHLWAQDYDRGLKDIFKIQDEVSQKIAESLQVAVENQIIDTAQKTQPKNIEAYTYYLKAKYVLHNKYYVSLDKKDSAEAIGYAEKSIEIDPEYALGYSIIANIYTVNYFFSNNQDDLQQAGHYANLAYKFGLNMPESIRAMSAFLLQKGDLDQSFNMMKKLIKDYPDDYENYYTLEGLFYLVIGMFHEQIKYSTRAIELNPVFHDLYCDRAWAYLYIWDKENAFRDIRSCLSLQPDAFMCKIENIFYLLWINDLENASKHIAELERRISAEKSPQPAEPVLNMGNNMVKVLRALYFAKLGKKDQALAIIKNLLSNTEEVNSPLLYLFASMPYAELDMAREAIQVLKECSKVTKGLKINFYENLSFTPAYDRIRNDPEFQKLLNQQKSIYDEMVHKYRIQ